MKWSYDIVQVFGIRIKLHLLFVIVLGVMLLQALAGPGGVLDAAETLVFFAVVFTLVVLHELGHSLTARRYGVQVLDITLLPFGGMARLASVPEDPAIEWKIAIAGPLVNVAIALLLAPLVLVFGLPSLPIVELTPAWVVGTLLAINLMMALFNLLPAFPMDGGRILRALLAYRYDYVTATDKAARVGRWIAVIGGLLMLSYGNFWLVAIAVFVYFAGTQEALAVRMRHAGFGLFTPPAAGRPAWQQPPQAAYEPYYRVDDAHIAEPETDAPAPPAPTTPATAERFAELARKLDEIRRRT